jgi:GH25 family lysozyme M1 (1,4-beta-N-acetylmuramidase)
MAEIGTLTVKVDYDMQAVKDALRTERMWYLEAFEKMEYAFEDVIDYDNPEQAGAMAACRDRMRALMEELGV